MMSNELSTLDELTRFKEETWVNGTHAELPLKKVLFAVRNRVGAVVCGESGVGKSAVAQQIFQKMSTSMDETQSYYPVVYAPLEPKTQVKGLLIDLLEQMGMENIDRLTEKQLRKMLYKQIRACEVRLIILDEFQHLLRQHNASLNSDVCDFIKVLMNQTGVSVALFGMEEGARLLDLNGQMKTRFSQPVIMRRMSLDADGEPRYFQWFVSELLKQYPRKTKGIDTWDAALRLLMACEGNLRELKKILGAMMVNSAPDPKRSLTLKDAEVAYLEVNHDKVFRGVNGRQIFPFRSDINIVHGYLKHASGIK